jgi:predicted anti-sigma-YlaC factor YlaD
MRCAKVEEHLAAYVDGRLAEAEHEALERHLATCSACREAAGEVSLAREALGALSPLRAPASFAPRVKAAVRAQVAEAYTYPLLGSDRRLWLSSAALAMIVACGLSWCWTGSQRDYIAPPSVAHSRPPSAVRVAARHARRAVESVALRMAMPAGDSASGASFAASHVQPAKELNALVAAAATPAALAPKPATGLAPSRTAGRALTPAVASARGDSPPASATEVRLPETFGGVAEAHAEYVVALANPEARLATRESAVVADAAAGRPAAGEASSPAAVVSLASLTSDRSLDWPSM